MFERSSGSSCRTETFQYIPQIRKVSYPERFPEVLFKCPFYQGQSLTRGGWGKRIEHLTTRLKKANPVHASIIEIKSLNHKELVEKCVRTLVYYVRQIVDQPTNELNKWIVIETPTFLENVKCSEGGVNFLFSIGFKEYLRDGKRALHYEEKYFSRLDLDLAIYMLRTINGFELTLDRDCRVWTGPFANTELFLSADFFERIPGEPNVDEKLNEYVKKCRAPVEARAIYSSRWGRRRALYTRIRVELPFGDTVEGTFQADEKLHHVSAYLDEIFPKLKRYRLFCLELMLERNAQDKTLEELRLVPFAFLKVQYENINNFGDQ